MSCIPADKMKKLLFEIKNLKGDVLALSKMSVEKRAKLFEKVIPAGDALSLSNKFERALLSKKKRALGDWLMKNFDEKTRAKMLTRQQKASIEKYILDRIAPIKREKVVVSSNEISKMSKKERDEFLKQHYSKEEIDELNTKLEKAMAIEDNKIFRKQAEKAEIVFEKKLEAQRKKIENFLEKIPKKERKSGELSAKQIVSLKESERLKYLKKIGFENAEQINEEIIDTLLKKKASQEAKIPLIIEARRVRSQKAIIENFTKGKKFFRTKINKSIEDILAMPEKERLEFIKKYITDKSPEQVNKEILIKSKPPFLKKLEKEIGSATNYREMDAYLNKKTNELFAKKNGVLITTEQTEEITRLSKEIEELNKKQLESGEFADRIAYGQKMLEMNNIVEKIALGDITKTEIAISSLNLSRILLSTGEFSAIAIQGFSHLSKYITGLVIKKDRNVYKTLISAVKSFWSKDAYEKVLADYITRDSAKYAKKANLRQSEISVNLSKREEDFMSNVFDILENKGNKLGGVTGKIFSGIGWSGRNIFDAFSRFYTTYLNSLRRETFDRQLYNLRGAGADIEDEKLLRYLGSTINDYTGGSSFIFGKQNLEQHVPLFSTAFFSPRNFLSVLKIFTVRPVKDLYKGVFGTKAEKMVALESIEMLTRTMATGATFMALASLNKEVEVETDPRSVDFGDVKFNGKTRLNVFGAKDWFITFVAQMATNEKKTKDDIIRELGIGIMPDRGDLIFDTIRKKFSPNVALIFDFIIGKNVMGEKFMAGITAEELKKALEGDEGMRALLETGAQRESFNRLVPMTYQSGIELFKENPELFAKLSLPMFAGFSVSTYGNETNWLDKDSKEMKQFKQVKGVQKFQEANDFYNSIIDTEIEKIRKSERYQKMDNDKKIKEIDRIKESVKRRTFVKFGFVYNKNLKFE